MKPRYSNPYIQNIRRSPLDFIRWQFGRYDDPMLIKAPPEQFIYPKPMMPLCPVSPRVEWVNHCTFLLTIDGVNILTDPIWSERCSPCPFVGPKRRHPPSKEIDALPDLDIVLISHNHYDHLDKSTIRTIHRFYPTVQWIVPKGVGRWLKKQKIMRIKELSWWEETTLVLAKDKPEITVVGVPAQHNSGRGLFDMNRSLWLGYVARIAKRFNQPNKYFYFVGDTAYNPYDFKKIGQAFERIDLCMCPIGTYSPGAFMRTVHSSPQDAVAIHRDVNAKLSLGMHWKTFRLSQEPMDRPPYDLYLEMKKEGLNPVHFLPLDPGEVVNW